MAQTIKLKRSSTSGAAPTTSQLSLGEVAINTYDGKMYIKKDVGGTESIVEITGGSGGSSTLGGLSDVTISSVQTDQILKYNGSAWVNASESGGSTAADAIVVEYQYTATSGQTTFSGADDDNDTLSYTANAIQVFLNGVLLDTNTDYTATNGTSVVFSSGLTAGDYLQVIAFKKRISNGDVSVNTFTGNNSTTAFTLSLDPGDENNTRVFVDGVYQSKSNYSVSGTTLTFSTAPPTDTAVEVEIGNRVVTLDTLSDLDLPDNVKLRLGTSQDLEIYHDGSHSYVSDAGTGGLKLTGGDVYVKNSSDADMIHATSGGAVTLYHNGSAKLATSSSGVDITNGHIKLSAGYSLQWDDSHERIEQSNGKLEFFTNNSQQMTISGSNVGIGTTTPAEELHISAAVPTLRLQDSDGTNQYLNIYQSGGGANYLASNNTSYGTHNFYGFNGTTSTVFVGFTQDAINQQTSAAWYIRNRVNGGSLNLGVETTAGSLYYPVQMNGTSDVLVFNNAEGEMARFDTNGRLGLGTASPNQKLHVKDSAAFILLESTSSNGFKAKNGSGSFYFGIDDSGGNFYGSSYARAIYADGAYPVTFYTNATERMRIDSSGNVGIGTQSPSRLAHLYGTSNPALRLDNGTNSVDIGIATSNGALLTGSATNDLVIARNGAYNIKLGTNGSTRATIDASGNVGIGESDPDSTLTVKGASHTNFQVKSNSESTKAFIQTVQDSDVRIGSSTNHPVSFYQNGNERMRINSAGRVGIGTTDPVSNLDVAGITPTLTIKDTQNKSWTSSDTTLGELAFRTSDASGIGAHNVSFVRAVNEVSSSSTPSGALSFGVSTANTNASEAMRIDSSGNVGIGTDNPLRPFHLNIGTNNTAALFQSTDTEVALEFTDPAGTAYFRASGDYIKMGATQSNSLTILDGGNVGIGVESPGYPLEIQSGGVGTVLRAGTSFISIDSTGSAASPSLIFNGDDDTGIYRAASDTLAVATGGAERMRINGSGDVRIGTAAVTGGRYLDIYNTGSTSTDFAIMRLITQQAGSSSSTTSEFYKRKNGETTIANFETGVDGYLRAVIGSTEGWRLHSSGNLLVGKSTPNLTAAGIELNSSGVAGKVWITRNAGEPLALNRLSNDGPIIELYKANSIVGSIGTNSGYMVIGSTVGTDAHLLIGNNLIHPATSSGAAKDNLISIGGSSNRFRDLYLSGTATTGSNIHLQDNGTTRGKIELNASDADDLDIKAVSLGSNMKFFTVDTERARIDSSGNLLVGTTAARTGNYSLSLEASNSLMYFRAAGTSSLSQTIFVRDTAGTPVIVGSIATTGTNTAYNTSSDQRLKDNIVDAPSASDDIDAIQVRSFDWKVDGSHQKYGMIAQELNTVAPDAVSAPEDPEDMMGVDYSKLVPMLVKALQEAKQEINNLKSRVEELESQ